MVDSITNFNNLNLEENEKMKKDYNNEKEEDEQEEQDEKEEDGDEEKAQITNNGTNNNNKMKKRDAVVFEITFLDTMGASEILDGFLFLGAGRDANNVQFITENKITHVLCMISAYKPKLVYSDYSIQYLHLPIRDSPCSQINVHFNAAIEFIENAKKTNSRILVHCAAGISRSTSIVLAYLMKSHNMNLRDAYELVLARRKVIRPNEGFFAQLLEYEAKLHGKTSMSISDLPYLFRKPKTSAQFTPSKEFATKEEGVDWATRVVGEGLLERIFDDICGGVYKADKTSEFLDKVLSDAKELPEVQEKQREGYKFPKLSINLMKRAAMWYKSKKDPLPN